MLFEPLAENFCGGFFIPGLFWRQEFLLSKPDKTRRRLQVSRRATKPFAISRRKSDISRHVIFFLLHLYTMISLIERVSNTWTAFVFGAVFNLLAAAPDETLIEFTIKTVIGGLIWLTFQIIANRFKKTDAKNENETNTENNKEEKS